VDGAVVGVRDAANDVVRLYLDGIQVVEQHTAFSAGFDSATANSISAIWP
jgi:hypothetical protein